MGTAGIGLDFYGSVVTVFGLFAPRFRTVRADYPSTAKPSHFRDEANRKWANGSSNKKFDTSGKARFDLKIGMQPGSNYRVAASVGDGQGYAHIQITNLYNTATCIGPELVQTANALVSEPLTVWRRLWVENNSMTAIPTDQFGYKRNDLSWDINPANVSNTLLSSTTTTFSIPKINDQSSFDDLAYGRIIVHGTSYPVTDTDHYGQSPYLVTVAGQINGLPQNPVFRLYDDDDFGLTTPSLPRLDLADDLMKKFFAPAFIEITDSGDYNRTKTVPFRVHDPLLPELASVTSDARELKEKMSLWVAPGA